MVTEAIVLAGGFGKRLSGVLPDVPKPMAPIAGQPFLVYLFRLLEANGIRRVILAVGYRNETIQAFFGARWGALDITYSVESEPLGTGGALLQALSSVQNPYALVVNGDTLLRMNYGEMGRAIERVPGAKVIVALRRIADGSRYGSAVVVDQRIHSFEAAGISGPALINGGVYIVARDLFDCYPMPRKFSWEQDFLAARAAEVRPLAYECDAPFIDIGVPRALDEAQTLIPEWLEEEEVQRLAGVSAEPSATTH